MKNLIYQFWDTYQSNGIPSGVQASVNSMKKYADQIGAKHLFEIDPPKLHSYKSAPYYGSVNPVFREEFHEYDNVLFTDADVFAVDGIKENIFNNFSGDIGLAQELYEPKRQIIENKRALGRSVYESWANTVENKFSISLPRTKDGLLKAFNSGVVLYSNAGLKKAKEKFISFKDYNDTIYMADNVQNFFAADQYYINTSMFKAGLDFVELDYRWNTEVFFFNKHPKEIFFDKNENTRLVHMQLRGMRWKQSEETLFKMVNDPVDTWGFDMIDITEREKPRLISN